MRFLRQEPFEMTETNYLHQDLQDVRIIKIKFCKFQYPLIPIYTITKTPGIGKVMLKLI